ncbi:hypothetical protein F8388_004856 [Cannabis sativa]|uniref:Uncharacterized protein n=1 Tax=Cannabis sativa TaxID=3483 RepID=A0A7J6HQ79_CANSA|nr:hypothetical protein F8388_004856 [Cannabis sativa]
MGRGGGEKEGSSSSSSSSSSPFSLSSEYHESLLREFEEEEEEDEIPTGFLAVYVGEERQRFVVPTTFLSHPLFKMLLEKAYEEFGFQQRNGLVVPCSVSSFRDVVNAVQCSNGVVADLGPELYEVAGVGAAVSCAPEIGANGQPETL